MGRHSIYTEEIAAEILSGLAEGKSLRKVCEPDGMPSSSAVMAWLEEPEYESFAEQYARTRARAYQMLADEILEISDDSSGDVIDTENGPKANAEFVARSRLRVDSRKWMLAKMLPKLYGEKLDLHHSGGVKFERIESVLIDGSPEG